MNEPLIPAVCPVCSHSLAVPFFDGGSQALATLGWPLTAAEARAMPRHPHDFVQCPQCSHVWNQSFCYDAIPYQNKPNRMFNLGVVWKGHLAKTRDLVLRHLPESPTVIDIGCGEGHFVRGLAEARDGVGRFVGFDPNTDRQTGRGLEFHAAYFEPLQHMQEFSPDGIVLRHVLEHLTHPTVLLDQLAWTAAALDKDCWLFVEVPCIDRVFETGRLADFFFEHMSHFTTESFRQLMSRAGEIVTLEHGYDREVVFALVRLGISDSMKKHAQSAQAFFQVANVNRARIRRQIDEWAVSGKRVAIWGGTGKAAAFIQQFTADAERFPLVVDSDADKAGTFVPGTGQKIQFRDVLKTMPADVIIIPTQWRARDIIAEMEREGITAEMVLIEHNGRLIDFLTDTHVYA